MPDNRITLTIEAQNLAQAAFKQFQTDVRQSNEALQKTGQAGRQGSGGIKVFRDELGRFHDATTGKFVSAARLLREGFTEVGRGAGDSTDAIKRANPVIARMRREYNLLRTDIHNTAAVTRQFATAIQSQIRSQVDAAANLERLRVGLVSIGGSLAAATTQYQRLVEVSRLPGINIENSLRTTLQLEALGKSGEDATEIIREFGNALALSGTAPRELNQVVNAIKQMSGEGKILQEDIAILTTRVAALIPHLKEAFGGTRAEDVREFFDALGVEESEQADRFLRIVLDRLKELPRAGDTAANAIENLNDTFGRVQATIGANFLPLVKESTAALEAFLMQAEQDEGLARNIATVEAFGASFLTVTAALTGVAAAIPAVSAAVSFLFTGPAAIAVGVVAALTAGFVAWKVASQEVESEVDRLNSTIDQNRRALISYQKAVTSGQLGDIQSAQRGIQAQRQQILRDIEGLIAERLNIEEQRDKLQSQINYQEFTGFEPSRARQDRLGELDAQAQNLRKAIEAARFEFLELGQSGRHLNELGKPLVDANVNTEKLTKSIKDLKEELQEEVTFEDVSRGLLGNEADFRKSATALADVEVLIKSNTDAFTKLGEAAASGNQQAIKGINDLNESLNELRETQADRHVDNLSTAFNSLTNTTDSSRKQFEAILKSAEAFVATFQGGAAVLQDDVGQGLTLIGNIRSQLQDLSSDEITLELHAEGAEDLTRALTDFHDLQRDVQEDATLDAQQSAEQQATAYIRAYRDSIDPAILNLVESVRLLREEVRGSIQDLEALNLQDKLRIELNEENLSPVADFFTELVDLQQAAQGDLTRSQIDSLEKRSQALRQYLYDDTAHFGAYASDIEAINETLTDKSLSLLEGVVQARQAQYDDDLKAQRQVEQAKRQENEKTYDFDVFLAGLRTKNRQQAAQEFVRLEERAFDASSKSQIENLIRETQQFLASYSARGKAFRDLVQDAQDLGANLQEAFDLTEQTRRLEDFQDSVAGVLENLAGVAVDHIFDSFADSAQVATDAVATFVDEVRGELELLQSDITRLTRFDEDQGTRRERLEEDRDRRLAQLQRQRRTIAARGGGDQRTIERSRQRSQDLSFRIAEVRENFAVRSARLGEDTDTRRNRLIEDAELRRERFEGRGGGESLLPKLGDSLANSISSAISSALASGLAGLLAGALQSPFQSLLDGIKGLFGGGGDGDGDTSGTTDLDGTLTIKQEDITLPEGSLDLTGQITLALTDITAPAEAVDLTGMTSLALSDITAPTESVDLTGRISAIEELSESVKLPPVPGLKGGLIDIVLQQNVSKPIVPGLTGEIAQIQLAENLELPSLPAIHVPIIYDVPELPEGNVEVGELTPVGEPGEIPTPASTAAEPIAGVITASLHRDFTEPVQIAGVVNADLPSFSEMIEVQAQIASLALATALPEIDLVGRVNAEVNVLTPQPIVLPGIINTTVNQPPLREGSVEVGELVPVAPPGEIPATAPAPAEQISGVITTSLHRDFAEPVQISGVINARTNIAAAGRGGSPRSLRDSNEEDPENEMLQVGDLTGEIDALSISEDAKALLEPVQLDGEINATLVKLFSEPIIIDGIINARINYGTGANIEQDGGGGGGEGQTAPPPGGQTAPNIGDFNPQTPGEQPTGQGFNLNPQGGLVANRNAGGGGGGGGGNAIQVTFPPSLRNAITDQAGTLKEIQASQKEFFQSSVAFFDSDGEQGLTANQHLSGIRRALLSEDAPQTPLATETTLMSMAETLNQIRFATERVADAPLVQGLVDAGVAFPNDPTDPTNAALTQSPVNDILSQGGLDLFANFDKIDRNLQTLLDAQSQAQGTPDLSVMGTSDNPIYIKDVDANVTRKVEVVNPQEKVEITNETLNVNAVVQNTVAVKQVGVIQVSQSGEFVVRLAGGGTLPVRVEGGRMEVDIASGLEGLAVDLADAEVSLRAVGAL